MGEMVKFNFHYFHQDENALAFVRKQKSSVDLADEEVWYQLVPGVIAGSTENG